MKAGSGGEAVTVVEVAEVAEKVPPLPPAAAGDDEPPMILPYLWV